MKNLIILTCILVVTLQFNISLNAQCTCTQLQSQQDCQKIVACLWNHLRSQCEVRLRTTSVSIPPTLTQVKSQCSRFSKAECAKAEGCAWLNNQCVVFTACSIFTFTTDQLCQEASQNCITDGTNCVQLDDCFTYQNQISCVKNLKSGNNHCFWDTSTDQPRCVEAIQCQQFPKYIKSDQECRALLIYCTVDPTGGCIQSGLTCADQKTQSQCYWDQYKTVPCEWDGKACWDRACSLAPKSRNTDQLCRSYLPNCTSLPEGGCIERRRCVDALYEGSCITDSANNNCFWEDGLCYKVTCENAPIRLLTLEDCQSFLPNCIPRIQGGCLTFTDCPVAQTEIGCLSGLLKCFWDGLICKSYTCSNASTTLTTFEECSAFKSDCTLSSSGSGCTERTCSNAPTTATTNLRTNYECHTYKTGCITQRGGGCRENTTCEAIDFEAACVEDATGRLCFWAVNRCVLKACQNALTTYTTHELCQAFSKDCTLNRSKQGCTDMECLMLDTRDKCAVDKNNNRCYWVGLCFQKTCENAPLTNEFNNDAKCRSYLAECTVSNSGYGCMRRPNLCSEMLLELQCVTTATNQICVWVNSACQDKSCSTAPLTSDYDSYEECNTYLSTCTVRPDGIGGCMTLAACSSYVAARSCRFNNVGTQCEFTNNVCADKNCNTAPQTSAYDTNDECVAYRSDCILSALGQGCMTKPTTCAGLTIANQCTLTIMMSGNLCAWVGGVCVNRLCTHAPASSEYDTFAECNAYLSTCTVVATGTGGCETMQSFCSAYSTFRQCEQLIGGGKCSWYNNACTNRICDWAPDTPAFDSDAECSAYLPTCTVVRRVGSQGCAVRKNGCQNLSEFQCIYEGGGAQCVWDTIAATPFCKLRDCTFTIGITSFTTVNCNNWKAGCVSNNSGNGCSDKLAWCSWYTSADNCQVTTGGTVCYWNGTSCVDRNCVTTEGISEFNHVNCVAWLGTCTSGKPTSCFDKPASCAAALNYDQCYYDINGVQCAWVGTACVDRTCNNHGYAVTIFTNGNCSGWMAGCSANPGATACEITRTCTNHGSAVPSFTHTNCQTWLNTCTVAGDLSSCIEKTCSNHGANVTVFNSGNCSTWLSTCTNDATNTSCITTKTCSSTNVTAFNHTNCNNWLSDCTVSGVACITKTCYNHATNVITFNHANCNSWLSSCTVSPDGLTCQPKTCSNHGSNVTVFNNANCSAWLSYCISNTLNTACISNRNCTATLSTYTQANCEAWNYQCAYNNSSSCRYKTCTNYTGITVYGHKNCATWLDVCTGNNTSCFEKTCWNYGQNVLEFTHSACQEWLQVCTVNQTRTGCDLKTCTNHGVLVTTFNNTTCGTWLSYCTVNGTNNACETTRTCGSASGFVTWSHQNCEVYHYGCTVSGSSCISKTCTNHGTLISTFTHSNCEQWLSTCTVNVAGTACEDKTCTNHRENLSALSHTGCTTWLPTCTINWIGTACENRTCDNYDTNVTVFTNPNCSAWQSTCTASGSTCVSSRTCTNHGGSVTVFNYANCSNWLYSCTNNGSSACIAKTCANASSTLTRFTYDNCINWLPTCTVNTNGTACIDKTCSNYSNNIPTFSAATCLRWLSSCTVNSTNDGCISARTCINHGSAVVSFTNANCAGWLATCTNNVGSTACLARTCSNYQSNVVTFNHTNCTNWLDSCTNNSTTACQDRSCTNYSTNLSTYTPVSCSVWMKFCTSNNGQTGCQTNRTCSNYGSHITVFNHNNCAAWLSTCTVNIGMDACVDRMCGNASLAVIGSFSDINCTSWHSKCTVTTLNDGCQDKVCANAPASIGTKNHANCENWYFLCTGNGTNCLDKTCTNHSLGTINAANCYGWLNSCSFYSSNCETVRTCASYTGPSFTFTNCTNWLSRCTTNGLACVDRTCFNYGSNVSSFTHTNCSNWLSECTVNSSADGCTLRTCSNYGANVVTFTNTNCANWLGYCTADWSATACTTGRTCYNHGASVLDFNHSNCQSWLSSCTVNATNNGCEDKTCSNYGTYLPFFDHINCSNWLPTCTNEGTTGCKERTCTNNNLTSFTNTTCASWLPYCKVNTSATNCEVRTCLNHAAMTINYTNCTGWLSYCTDNSAGSECYTTRTCANYGKNVTIFTHQTCEQWLSLCTANAARTACEPKTCFNHRTLLTVFTNTTCAGWFQNCKVNSNSTGCEYKTCSNYGTAVSTFNSTTCTAWMPECTNNGAVSCQTTTRACTRTSYSTTIERYDHPTCQSWYSACVPSPTQTSCVDRTCYNYASHITSFSHYSCDSWSKGCTVNGTATGCEVRSCNNFGANISNFNHTNCTDWLSTCTINSNGNTCIDRTCYNFGSQITVFNHTNCNNWLSSCTNDGTSGCAVKTCSNHTIGTFNHTNCSNWLSYCTVHPMGGSCVDVRDCKNHGTAVTLFNHANCSTWLVTCTVNQTNSACVAKTCDNYQTNITAFNHVNCYIWLPTCTVNAAMNKCEQRSCVNHGTFVTNFTDPNCSSWLSTCKAAPSGTACEAKTCTNHSVMTFNHTNCSNWLSYCTVSLDGKSCTTLRTCTNHGDNVVAFNHASCSAWMANCTSNSFGTACVEKTCASFVGTVNHNNCQNWLFSCTAENGNCVEKSCTNYDSNVLVFTHANCSGWLSTCTVNSSSSACILKTCVNTTGIATWTHANCEAWKSTCQLNKPTTCTNMQSNCANAGVSYNQCVKDTANDNCTWYNGTCVDRTCANYTGPVFTHANCESWLSSCTVDSNGVHTSCVTKPANCTTIGVVQDQCVKSFSGVSCTWITGSCQNRTCANYSGAFTHANCEGWLNTCTTDANALHVACVSKQPICSGYTHQDQCVVSSSAVSCFWTGSACVDRTCDHATQDASFTTDAACKAFLPTCTVARAGECMTRLANCSDYKQQSQCVKTLTNGNCYWNTTSLLCLDLTCLNAPTTLTDHAQCQSFLNTCTVNVGGAGCVSLNTCPSYTAQRQCVKSTTNEICAWAFNACYVKACMTAPLDNNYDTHAKCQAYLPTCTVNATGVGGCFNLAACNTYTSERQCVVNTANQLCGWNGSRCDVKSCYTAPSTTAYSTDASCEAYFTGCTVVPTGSGGCQSKAQSCSAYTTQRQCVKTLTGGLCYWNIEKTPPVCELRTCSNAPDSARTPQLCEKHFAQCYSDLKYCRIEQCEDIILTSNDECRLANRTCTSNGEKCITRKSCAEAPTITACVEDASGNECAWIISPIRSYCTLRNCETAPSYYNTEPLCQEYFPAGNCTTKSFGGCMAKSTCERAIGRLACTTSAKGEPCIWVLSGQYCRVEECSDYRGYNDKECDAQKVGCVADPLTGFCIKPQYCSDFKTSADCQVGKDGICAWQGGGCVKFSGCRSVAGKDDAVCKQVSQYCTTDGTKCVGIQSCAAYKIQDACRTGTDGPCVWIQGATQEANDGKCRRFQTCYDLPYLTHAKCNQMHTGCTSDTVSHCIPLLSCGQYTNSDQCQLSALGKLTDQSGAVISTGKCLWSQNYRQVWSCRDQICSDLIGATHEACREQLSSCTSDGVKCVSMTDCASYSDNNTCKAATGLDGKCVIDNRVCRGFICQDITETYSHETCEKAMKGCIYDGSGCIKKDICGNYRSSIACGFGGVDGVCVWDDSACKLMLSCSEANSDSTACRKMSESCYWKTSTSSSPSECIPHTCQSKFENLSKCTSISGLNDEITPCRREGNACVPAEAEILGRDECLENTQWYYYWSLKENRCTQCKAIANNSIVTPAPQVVSKFSMLQVIGFLLLVQ